MKTLHARLCRKEVTYKGRKFTTYYVKYLNKNNEVKYLDVTIKNSKLSLVEKLLINGFIDVELRKADKKEERDNCNMAILPKSKLGEDGKYHDVLDKDGNQIPKIVILDNFNPTDVLSTPLSFPTKPKNDDTFGDDIF